MNKEINFNLVDHNLILEDEEFQKISIFLKQNNTLKKVSESQINDFINNKAMLGIKFSRKNDELHEAMVWLERAVADINDFNKEFEEALEGVEDDDWKKIYEEYIKDNDYTDESGKVKEGINELKKYIRDVDYTYDVCNLFWQSKLIDKEIINIQGQKIEGLIENVDVMDVLTNVVEKLEKDFQLEEDMIYQNVSPIREKLRKTMEDVIEREFVLIEEKLNKILKSSEINEKRLNDYIENGLGNKESIQYLLSENKNIMQMCNENLEQVDNGYQQIIYSIDHGYKRISENSSINACGRIRDIIKASSNVIPQMIYLFKGINDRYKSLEDNINRNMDYIKNKEEEKKILNRIEAKYKIEDKIQEQSWMLDYISEEIKKLDKIDEDIEGLKERERRGEKLSDNNKALTQVDFNPERQKLEKLYEKLQEVNCMVIDQHKVELEEELSNIHNEITIKNVLPLMSIKRQKKELHNVENRIKKFISVLEKIGFSEKIKNSVDKIKSTELVVSINNMFVKSKNIIPNLYKKSSKDKNNEGDIIKNIIKTAKLEDISEYVGSEEKNVENKTEEKINYQNKSLELIMAVKNMKVDEIEELISKNETFESIALINIIKNLSQKGESNLVDKILNKYGESLNLVDCASILGIDMLEAKTEGIDVLKNKIRINSLENKVNKDIPANIKKPHETTSKLNKVNKKDKDLEKNINK